MPELPNFIAEINEERSLSDDIPFIVSKHDVDTRTFISSSSAASTIPEVIFISPSHSLTTYIPNSTSTDEQGSPDSTSTTKASDNDPTVEIPSTAAV